MKIGLLFLTLCSLSMVNSYTILDPNSGYVKTDLKKLASNEEGISEYAEDPNKTLIIKQLQAKGSGNDQDQEGAAEIKPGQEYLDENGYPIYKKFQKHPYGHRLGDEAPIFQTPGQNN